MLRSSKVDQVLAKIEGARLIKEAGAARKAGFPHVAEVLLQRGLAQLKIVQ